MLHNHLLDEMRYIPGATNPSRQKYLFLVLLACHVFAEEKRELLRKPWPAQQTRLNGLELSALRVFSDTKSTVHISKKKNECLFSFFFRG